MSEPFLPCGRDPLDVADHAAAGVLDDHELACEYCGRVTAATALSARLGSEAAAVELPAPSGDLVPTVMRTVRAELRTARQIPLTSEHGAAFATDHVIATVLRDVLDAAGGLVVSSCRVELLADTGIGVRVEALGRYLDDLATGADAVRELVVSTLSQQFGVVAGAGVDVAVVDLVGTP